MIGLGHFQLLLEIKLNWRGASLSLPGPTPPLPPSPPSLPLLPLHLLLLLLLQRLSGLHGQPVVYGPQVVAMKTTIGSPDRCTPAEYMKSCNFYWNFTTTRVVEASDQARSDFYGMFARLVSCQLFTNLYSWEWKGWQIPWSGKLQMRKDNNTKLHKLIYCL